jgi:transposase InsO family protein
VARVTQERWTVRAAASAGGVSVRTAYKWLARVRETTATLHDRSSRPRASPRQTSAALEAAIARLRAGRASGPHIAQRLGIPRSTVGHVLRRHGLGRLPPLVPRPPVQRYEWARPGELVHVDTKALGRIGMVGHRITGVRQHRTRGIGWEHVHVCIDDASRLSYVEVRATNQQADTVAFLERAVAWFAARGVRIERVMSDNGSAYVSRRFAAACAALGLRHLRTRAYTPRTNGKAERFIQTLLREWAYARPYPTSRWRRRALPRWLRYYNHQRPHTALRYRAPITRLHEVST